MAVVTLHAAKTNLHHLPLDARGAGRAGGLPGPHRDPFDRLLLAQAITADLTLISNEEVFGAYGARRLR